MFNTEIRKLIKLLGNASIPYQLNACGDGWQIVYPASGDAYICDVICNSLSLGHEDDLLELMGLENPVTRKREIEGYLTAQDVFSRIQAHYLKYKSFEIPPICELIEIGCDYCPFSDDENHECLCTSEAVQQYLELANKISTALKERNTKI